MMDNAQRLKRARIDAGFPTGAAAAARFNWKYPTYAGHENGSRGFDIEDAKAYAKAFKVDFLWLIGAAQSPSGPPLPSGLAEPDLVPFQGRTAENLAKIAAPLARHQMIYRCARDHFGFAVLQNDLVVLGSPTDKDGDGLVVVNMVDTTAGYATTVLRHKKRDVLFPPIGQELPDEAALTPTILGHVLAVIRAPQIVD